MPRDLALPLPLAADPASARPARPAVRVSDHAARPAPPATAAGALDDFEPFYRAHVGRVHALCLRMCGDRGRAEELTQDVFVRAWEKRGTFRGAARAATWLHRLAVNVVLAGARAERRRLARVEPADAPDALPGARPDAAPDAAAGARLDLERAIAALPEGARTAFVLHDVEGYSHDEIARLTGVAPGTVRSQLHRARRLLLEALDR
jgi:RNA polymerase sigma-70 factor (ECF subfamily)